MTFRSILGDQPSADASAEAAQAPVYFVDFNLDQIVTAITAGKGEYNLKPFFYRPLKDSDAIAYRHEVLRDLENAALLGCVNAFADKMKSMREHLIQSGKMHYRYQKEAWFLDAVDIYCDAVGDLVAGLKASEARSRGFLSLRQYLIGYVDSPAFQTLSEDTRGLKHQLNAIRYSLVIKDGVVTVSNWRSEIDYGAAIQADFEKFKQGAASDHRFKFADFAQMNHIEAGILDRVARLYPETFLALDSYFLRNGDYQDRAVRIFDREVQFYVSYIEYMDPFKQSGLSFCYPVVSRENKAIAVSEGFDPALARKLLGEKSLVVCNDFQLRGKERVIIVSGPNQGRQNDLRADVRTIAPFGLDRLSGPRRERAAVLVRRALCALRETGRHSQSAWQITGRSDQNTRDAELCDNE